MIAFVGSRGVMSQHVARHVAWKMLALPPHTSILVRCSTRGDPRSFEASVEALALAAGHVVTYVRPALGGRAAVFRRDYEMVDRADIVEAYFRHDMVMDGGTGHVVDAAIKRDKPVRAWVATEEGSVDRVGELDPAFAES